jgi:hypothetical protein
MVHHIPDGDKNTLTLLFAKEYCIPFAQKHYIITVTNKLACTKISPERCTNMEWVQNKFDLIPSGHIHPHTHIDDRKPPVLPSVGLFSLAWVVNCEGTILTMDYSTDHNP